LEISLDTQLSSCDLLLLLSCSAFSIFSLLLLLFLLRGEAVRRRLLA
jgi:hypothetical protein